MKMPQTRYAKSGDLSIAYQWSRPCRPLRARDP